MSLAPDDPLDDAPGRPRDPSDAARLVIGDTTPPQAQEPVILPHRGSGPWVPRGRALFGASQLQLVYGAPWKALNAGRCYYAVCLDPEFDKRYTSDAKPRPFGWCIRRGFLDIGCFCGLRFWETKNPAQAHFRFGLRHFDDVAAMNRGGTDSGYIHATRGRADIFLGDRLKPAYGSVPPSAENFTRFAMKAWGEAVGLWGYNGWSGETWHRGGFPGDHWTAMRNPNFGGSLSQPLRGWDARETALLSLLRPAVADGRDAVSVQLLGWLVCAVVALAVWGGLYRRLGAALLLLCLCGSASAAPAEAGKPRDDTAYIQALIDRGGVVRLDGEYSLSGTLTVNGDDVRLVGGGTLRWTRNVVGISSVGHDGLTIDGLTLVGQRSSDTQTGNGHGVYVGDAAGVRLVGATVRDWSGHGIILTGFDGRGAGVNYPRGVHDSWVTDCTVSRCSGGIVAYNDGRRITIRGNHVSRCVLPCVFSDDSELTDGREQPRECVGIVIEANAASDFRSAGIAVSGTVAGAVRGNTVSDGGHGWGTFANGIVLQTGQNPEVTCRGNVVEGNVVRRCSNFGLSLQGASGNLIRGNLILDNAYRRPGGGTAQVDLRSQTYKGVTVGSSGNLVAGNLIDASDPECKVTTQVRVADEACEGNDLRGNWLRGKRAERDVTDKGTGTRVEPSPEAAVVIDGGCLGLAQVPALAPGGGFEAADEQRGDEAEDHGEDGEEGDRVGRQGGGHVRVSESVRGVRFQCENAADAGQVHGGRE